MFSDDQLAAEQLQGESHSKLTEESPVSDRERERKAAEEQCKLLNDFALKGVANARSPNKLRYAPSQSISTKPIAKRKREQHESAEALSKRRQTTEFQPSTVVQQAGSAQADAGDKPGKLTRPQKLRQDRTRVHRENSLDDDIYSIPEAPSHSMATHENTEDEGESHHTKTAAARVALRNTCLKSSKTKKPYSSLPQAHLTADKNSVEPTQSPCRLRRLKHHSQLPRGANSTVVPELDSGDKTPEDTNVDAEVADVDSDYGNPIGGGNPVDDSVQEQELHASDPCEEGNAPKSVTILKEFQTKGPYIELFGKERNWGVVLEGLRSVGVSESGEDRKQILLPLKTKTVKTWVQRARKARKYFTRLRLAKQEVQHEQIEDLEKLIAEELRMIEKDVEDLDEAQTGTKRSEVIKDIYAYGIPSLVEVLCSGLLCETDEYSRPDDTSAIVCIINIMDTILMLCKKASQWKPRPNSTTPVMKATTQKISPNLRNMRKAFFNELEERRRNERESRIQSDLIRSHAKRAEERREKEAENVRKRRENCHRLDQDLRHRHEECFDSTPHGRISSQVPTQTQQTQPTHSSSEANPWTRQEDLQLLVQLQNKDTRTLPGMCMYDKVIRYVVI